MYEVNEAAWRHLMWPWPDDARTAQINVWQWPTVDMLNGANRWWRCPILSSLSSGCKVACEN